MMHALQVLPMCAYPWMALLFSTTLQYALKVRVQILRHPVHVLTFTDSVLFHLGAPIGGNVAAAHEARHDNIDAAAHAARAVALAVAAARSHVSWSRRRPDHLHEHQGRGHLPALSMC